jgi:hypothetical protein
VTVHPTLSVEHFSFIAAGRDAELDRTYRTLARAFTVDGRNDFGDTLGELLGKNIPNARITLDLIGHSVPGTSLLRLGDWVIDAAQSSVVSFWRELAENGVLQRLGVESIRLLGCDTAGTDRGRWTICALAQLVGVEVFGTTNLVHAAHYDRAGFADRHAYLLVGSTELRERSIAAPTRETGPRHPRALDLDALPTEPLPTTPPAWPLHVPTREQSHQLLRLVRRRDGAEMPGLLAGPICELALPADAADRYYRMQIVLDGEFVRFYPRGTGQVGIVYPVEDPAALLAIVDTIA